jgi:hypothetical protein
VLEYEIKKKNVREKDNIYVSKDELLAMGFKHLLRQTDEKIASKEAGLDLRLCTTTEIQRHLDDFGLVLEFGTYGKIRGLSGGQKVKLVLAAAMWNCKYLDPTLVRASSPLVRVGAYLTRPSFTHFLTWINLPRPPHPQARIFWCWTNPRITSTARRWARFPRR